ncbi:MAG: M20 family metallopeptidase [Ilumatobacteraceae bacterium]
MVQTTEALLETVRDEARDLLDGLVGLRRELHAWPEVGNDLPKTREAVLAALEGLPLDITLHETTSGIAAILDGGRPGPTILLRGDMDALPMPEDTGLDFASKVDGQMHACGHDTHTSMLVGAARLLSARQADLPGRVLLMFQPGEEGYGGAKYMLEEGLLDIGPRPDGSESPITGAFALHISSSLPSGFVTTRQGPIMASSDRLQITVTGRGGHASEPHRALDPIPVACEIVQALQTMVTRRIDVFDPGVVTVARISAGTTNNVIPETAEIEGTIRAVSERTRSRIHDGIRRVAEGIGAAHDAQIEVRIPSDGYPVTVNDGSFAEFAGGVAADAIGDDHVLRLPNPVMGAEDFSYVIQRLPGAMMFLGGTPPDRDLSTAAPNHSNRVYFDEEAMVNGVSVYTSVAIRHLAGGA